MAVFIFIMTLLSASAQQPRLLLTTDIGGDPDDQQSLIRLMLYANEFENEGFICSASGTPGELKEKVVRPDLVKQIIAAYGQVYPNLLQHDKNYPLPAKLQSLIKSGNPQRGWDHVGEGNDTEGSDWIIRVVDKEDERPLNICIFGGQTDLAQALWKVKNYRTKKEYQKFISKIRIYDINDQDHIFETIIAAHPTLFYLLAKAPEGVDKRQGLYRGMYLGGNERLTSLKWIKNNVTVGHGALGELYPTKTWTQPNPHGVLKEGDTPSWFFFLKNGLNNPQHPEFGGWGGRFQKHNKGYFIDDIDEFDGEKNARATVYRWREDFQNDFSARMDWCVNNYDDANHAPLISLNGSATNEALIISAEQGDTIRLDASASKDPDNDSLSFEWMLYPEPEIHNWQPPLIKNNGSKASLKVPLLDDETSLHLILKVKDNGTPALTAYRRIIIKN
ncbi:nucleoside hydrolase-like domain-containing protein [uncultured Draconibacterium sp.]|uniref:DUF1593 domain-containing protein n=1 Tax=uncultured Draconibacterium sp. TaxID=1573823 RepID=UPI0029C7CA53|nr:nucleoside hydrolase-like domain-containing protein [uncultured Draconibacterium sp.]